MKIGDCIGFGTNSIYGYGIDMLTDLVDARSPG